MTMFRNRRLLPAPLAACLALVAGAAPASALIYTGEVAFTSDYVWRGISQTNGDPSVQGAIEFEAGIGAAAMFFGVWGSNVSNGNANLELDPYVGIRLGLNEGLGLSVQATQYTYHGELATGPETDFAELSATLGLPFVNIYAATSDDYLATGNTALWAGFDFRLGLFNLGAEYTDADGPIGYELSVDGTKNAPITEYLTAFAGIDYEVIGLGLEAKVYATDLEENSTLCKSNRGDICGTRIVLSLSRSF